MCCLLALKEAAEPLLAPLAAGVVVGCWHRSAGRGPPRSPPQAFPPMNRSTAYAARLAALRARSTATDAAAAQTLTELQQQGHQLATAMTALADQMEAGQ